MGDLVLGGQRLTGAQFFQHVVDIGQRQLGVLCLLAFAVGVETFGVVADCGLLFGAGVGEGEGFEAI